MEALLFLGVVLGIPIALAIFLHFREKKKKTLEKERKAREQAEFINNPPPIVVKRKPGGGHEAFPNRGSRYGRSGLYPDGAKLGSDPPNLNFLVRNLWQTTWRPDCDIRAAEGGVAC